MPIPRRPGRTYNWLVAATADVALAPAGTNAAGSAPESRLRLLCDPGSLEPIRSAVRPRDTAGRAGDGVLAAFARVDGRRVVCYAQDAVTTAGSVGEAHGDTIVRALRTAGRAGVPVVGFAESAGARLDEGVWGLAACGRVLAAHVALAGRVPQIAVVAGSSAGAGAYAPALTDFVVMTGGAAMFLTGPRVVRSAIGEDVDAQALGGARVQTRNGVCHFHAQDMPRAVELVRDLLSYLPSSVGGPLPAARAAEPAADDPARCVPAAPGRGYDVRHVIAALVDGGRLLEVSAAWARNVVTGFARLAGQPVSVVATQPRHLGGLIDAAAAQKAARFVAGCDRFGLPLVVLVDTPGFMPGRRQEAAAIIRHGSDLLRAFAAARVPKLTVVLRKAFGGAYIALNSIELGADLYLVWPGAQIGIMARGSAALVSRRAAQEVSAASAAARGFVDEVVEPRETRARLCGALELLGARG
jgi:acetyl-CoA carboxylase carboxyltransferase component